ncbi:LysR substrate-binding domain-containing protein [Pseudomonas syringae]|uniref:LysR substrate-binding domain-containing protein n=1 Tax=Pseudomonas syringae TaxID=317 RepID=UPI003F74BD24
MEKIVTTCQRTSSLQAPFVLSVSNFNSLVSALTHSDLVAVLPERLVRDQPALRVQAPPLVIPGFEMLMLWPERLHRDPAHIWLRNLIASTLQTASDLEPI